MKKHTFFAVLALVLAAGLLQPLGAAENQDQGKSGSSAGQDPKKTENQGKTQNSNKAEPKFISGNSPSANESAKSNEDQAAGSQKKQNSGSPQQSITQEDVKKRNDPRANLKIFSSMNEQLGAGSHGAWEQEMRISNDTPDYIQPLGDYPNTVYPVYQEASRQPWIYNPPEDRIPEQLKQAMRGEKIEPTPEQKAQQRFNKGTYTEPSNHPFRSKSDQSDDPGSKKSSSGNQNPGT